MAASPANPTEAWKTQTTYRWEKLRAISSGIIESAASTFLLLIAVSWFHAPSGWKSIIAAGSSLGLLVSPLIVFLTARARIPAAVASSRILMGGAVAMLIAGLFPSQEIFALGSTLGIVCWTCTVPLLTQIYQENYPASLRGKLFAGTVMIRIAAAAAASAVAGWALNGRMELFPWLLGLFGVALAFSGWCLKHCPSSALHPDAGVHPLTGMRHIRTDPLFRTALISWMLMGFANLMMLPLRIEHLASPTHGLGLDAGQVALFTGVIPHAARFVMSPIWGRLFDRMNFFALRVTLNVGFAIGIFSFFSNDSALGLAVSAVIYGISHAGGDVAWSLWVTRFAPADRVAEYMSIHTFTTGIRGVIAPVAAFALIENFSTSTLALGCALLILGASALLLPEIRSSRGNAPTRRG